MLHFRATPPFGALGTTHNVHLRLIGKHVVSRLPISFNLLFSLGVIKARPNLPGQIVELVFL